MELNCFLAGPAGALHCYSIFTILSCTILYVVLLMVGIS